jgi:Na+(H+)/acetate symporter ActP
MLDPGASTARRVTVSKILLLVVAIIAAWVTSYKPGNILFLVGAAFSLAASAFFPALVLGIFWKRANKWGAIIGMLAGLAICMYYMSVTYPFFRDLLGVTAPVASYQWFGMNAISAGVFGVPVGLLTIANALSHDLYYKMLDPGASTARRVTVSKILLLLVAILAAWVTSYKPGNILFLVGAAFSLAASAFFPALVLGIFWKRANKWGAIIGMLAGLGVCMYYMSVTYPFFRDLLGVTAPIASYQWFGMNAISAGVFGLPVGLATIIIVSLLTPAPEKAVQELVEHVRYPNLAGDIDTRAS